MEIWDLFRLNGVQEMQRLRWEKDRDARFRQQVREQR